VTAAAAPPARNPAAARLLVSEIFGPTIQGEGPSCGQQAIFVRLSRCNLSCPRCDTPYTWDWSRYSAAGETSTLLPGEVTAAVLDLPAALVVITGGEPLLQQNRLGPVVAELCAAGRRVEIETNGTVVPCTRLAETVTQWNVSPKLAGFASSADAARRIRPPALAALAATGRAVFKFAVSGVGDLDEIAALQDRHGMTEVWVMPEGTTAEGILATMRVIADPVIARGWNLTTRLHIMLWGDTRGR
jgi:7-carboxy-7-deazaguanine synthase